MKSIRETATLIAARFAKPSERFQLADVIEQALRDRDERAAKIAADHYSMLSSDLRHEGKSCGEATAAAIRSDEP